MTRDFVSFSGEACALAFVRVDSVQVFGICLQSGRRSVSGEGASKPQRDFPRVTAPRRAASNAITRPRPEFVLCVFAPRGFLVVPAFAVLLAAVHGRSHLGSYGSACELKGADACGDDDGEARGCAKVLRRKRKEESMEPTAIGSISSALLGV